MDRRFVLAGILGIAASVWLCAQGSQPLVTPTVQDAIAATRGQIQADRQAVVAANLGLTEKEGAAFWPLYREYREEMAKLGDRTAKVITDFAEHYDTMTDAEAKTLLAESIAIQKAEAAVRERWVPKFEKVLPAKKVARFYQIENKLDLLVRLAVSQEIPLVK
jgi:hypothetical protein